MASYQFIQHRLFKNVLKFFDGVVRRAGHTLICITDFRYPHELRCLSTEFGLKARVITVEIQRATVVARAMEEEHQLAGFFCDHVVTNDGSFTDLSEKARLMLLNLGLI